MRLEPLYRATFTTPEHWRVALADEQGTEDAEGLRVDAEVAALVWGPVGASASP
jgi:hypothetical protein